MASNSPCGNLTLISGMNKLIGQISLNKDLLLNEWEQPTFDFVALRNSYLYKK